MHIHVHIYTYINTHIYKCIHIYIYKIGPLLRRQDVGRTEKRAKKNKIKKRHTYDRASSQTTRCQADAETS